MIYLIMKSEAMVVTVQGGAKYRPPQVCIINKGEEVYGVTDSNYSAQVLVSRDYVVCHAFTVYLYKRLVISFNLEPTDTIVTCLPTSLQSHTILNIHFKIIHPKRFSSFLVVNKTFYEGIFIST